MTSIDKIVELNKKIDALMQKRTKANAQREVWASRVEGQLKDYKEKYGVDLFVGDIKALEKNIEQEKARVDKFISEEYEKRNKVVTLIESGDIAGAEVLLGVRREEPKEEFQEVTQSETLAETPVETKVGVVVSKEDDKGVAQVAEPVVSLEDLDDNDFYGTTSSTEGVERVDTDSSKVLVLEDDEEEEEEISKPRKSIILDDDDDDDDFGGFGSILQGSKFKV